MPVNARKKDSLPRDLASDYNALPKLEKLDLGAFSPIVNVAPSVIPVGYPAVRVFTYNVSALNEGRQGSKRSGKGVHRLLDDDNNDDIRDDEFGEDVERALAKDCRLKKNSSKKRCRIKNAHNNATSPSRTNTALTPLGYSQFVIDNLDFNESTIPRYTLEYMTYSLAVLDEASNYPIPYHLLPVVLLNRSSSSSPLPPHQTPTSTAGVKLRSAKDLTPYKIADLTIPSYLKLARRLGKGATAKKKGKIWKRYTRYMYLNL